MLHNRTRPDTVHTRRRRICALAYASVTPTIRQADEDMARQRAARRRGRAWLTVLRALLGRWLLLLRRLAAIGHGHDVGTALEWLVEAADVTGHILVSLDSKGDQGLLVSNA